MSVITVFIRIGLVIRFVNGYASPMNDLRKILIVEDEPLISMMLENFLECLDKEVVGIAENVEEAIVLIASGGIDAAILDVNLRDGERSAPVALALADLGIPFVVASGGGSTLEPVFHGRTILSKPFSLGGMEYALNQLSPSGRLSKVA